MENILDVHGTQMKIVKKYCKISNNGIKINLKW